MKVDIVIPLFNEAECIESLLAELQAQFSQDGSFDVRFILVDDGSRDATGDVIHQLAQANDNVIDLHLWGNHGHQRALVAGLDHVDADLVLTMDGDGQHPAVTALELLQTLRDSSDTDVVQAIRKGVQQGVFKNVASWCFYRSMNVLMRDAQLKPGASDFRALRMRVVKRVNAYPDRHRNLRVLLASLRLATKYVEYEVDQRISGESGYGIRQMFRLALNGWFAFSSSPLRVSLLLMLCTGAFGLLYLGYSLVAFLHGETVSGWTSIIALMAFFFSGLFGVLAIVAEYISHIYQDVKQHPVYTLKDH